jgi:hypothetical protein
MSRQLPNFGAALNRRVVEALRIAEAGELSFVQSAATGRPVGIHPARLQAIYEMAFLRIYVGWEATLEEVFLRLLCGYSSPRCSTTLQPLGSYFRSLSLAEAALLRGARYILWHDPSRIVQRSQRYFAASTFELVIATNTARLLSLASIRHRITHAHQDARTRFDAATMAIAGRRYRGSRPGAFLRDVSPARNERWLTVLADEFVNLAAQIS